ncbi:hypothetical protein [Arthrobacter sp. NamB2]|uniref:hypothetical protein n=1 Tax=Arthrobacter sp. NamB2 TaxID=2576035 RepID=UPI001CB91662|nr:hypothetical protein [Arthrobacter sp. NamB2]
MVADHALLLGDPLLELVRADLARRPGEGALGLRQFPGEAAEVLAESCLPQLFRIEPLRHAHLLGQSVGHLDRRLEGDVLGGEQVAVGVAQDEPDRCPVQLVRPVLPRVAARVTSGCDFRLEDCTGSAELQLLGQFPEFARGVPRIGKSTEE